MIKHLNFHFIDELLNDKDGKPKSSLRSQMLYIRIIIKHFRGIKPTIRNLAPFKITNADLPWVIWEEALEELQKLGLIAIDKTGTEYTYRFLNKWEDYIDKNRLEPKSAKNTIDKFEFDIKTNEPTRQLMELRDNIKGKNADQVFEIFFAEQKAVDKEYKDLLDAKSHFLHWLKANRDMFMAPLTTNSAKGTSFPKQN
jgi:hypothetical protein